MIFEVSISNFKILDPQGFNFTGNNATLGAVLSAALKYVFPIVGLILLFMLISGGIQLMTSATNPEATAKGYQKILYAIIGFIVVFVSYWLIQLLEVIFGISVLK